MAKKFDYKQFMLEKGERVVLGLAVFLMLLLIGLGVWSYAASDSPKDVAERLNAGTNEIKRKLDTTRPNAEDGKIDDTLLKGIVAKNIPRNEYLLVNDFFSATPLEDSKWQKIKVLPPDEFKATVFAAPVKVIVTTGKDEDVRVKIYKSGQALQRVSCDGQSSRSATSEDQRR